MRYIAFLVRAVIMLVWGACAGAYFAFHAMAEGLEIAWRELDE